MHRELFAPYQAQLKRDPPLSYQPRGKSAHSSEGEELGFNDMGRGPGFVEGSDDGLTFGSIDGIIIDSYEGLALGSSDGKLLG